MKQLSTFFKLYLPAVAAAFILLVNVYQFPEINSDSPAHHRAIHRYETSDVIRLSATNVENTHNLFTTLHRRTDQPTIIVPKNHSTASEGNNYRARLLGLVQPEKIEEVDFSPESVLRHITDTQPEPTAQDYMWEWPGPAREEDMETATKWRLYLADGNPPTLLLVDSGQTDPYEWTVVDVRLLPSSLLEEVKE